MNPLDELIGQTLTGLFLENTRLHLRLQDQVVTINLEDGFMIKNRRRRRGSPNTPWVVLPGWLRIVRVTHAKELTLDVSGALYASQIIVKKHKNGQWQVVLKGGFAAPPLNPRNL